MSNNHIMDFRNTVEAIVSDKIIEEQMRYVFPVKEYRGYIFTTKSISKNTIKGEKYLKSDDVVDNIYIKFFSSNAPHDFRKLSLPFKNVG